MRVEKSKGNYGTLGDSPFSRIVGETSLTDHGPMIKSEIGCGSNFRDEEEIAGGEVLPHIPEAVSVAGFRDCKSRKKLANVLTLRAQWRRFGLPPHSDLQSTPLSPSSLRGSCRG